MASMRTFFGESLCVAVATLAGIAWADEPSAPVPTPGITVPRTSDDDASEVEHQPQWELAFDEFIATDEYAAVLDYFKIEVAAIATDGKVEYISNLRKRKPELRFGELATDPRLWIGWRRGTLEAIDRQLLARAGVNVKNKRVAHFFPELLRKRLAIIERAYAQRDRSLIKRTRFRIVPNAAGDGYEFVVVQQDPPRSAKTPVSRSENRPRVSE